MRLDTPGFRTTGLVLTRQRVAHAISYRPRFLNRLVSHQTAPIILRIPTSSIYRFSASNAAKPVLDIDWTISDGESWAIVGNAGDEKTCLLETLKGQTRINPPPPKGIWPFLYEKGLDPVDHIRSVSFAHRPRAAGGGGFYDYSARYGAVREGDAVSLRQSLLENAQEQGMEDSVVPLAAALELLQFLDLPLVALSNGQTRRARIVKALLRKPMILLLDEPLTGLDQRHRPRLMSLLHGLHHQRNPRIIISLRMQDPVPDWITHVALVQPGGHVATGEKAAVLVNIEKETVHTEQQSPWRNTLHRSPEIQRSVLVDLQGVNVAYHDRHILKNITWTIRKGERWVLQGPNGSGKTTLLSMITGDVRKIYQATKRAIDDISSLQHPQSFTQSHLHLFGLPRGRIATPTIARRIGICSPELYNAFPRRSGPQGLTVRDAITSGFDGIFTYRKPTAEQAKRVDCLLEDLGPVVWAENAGPSATDEFGKRIFADLTPGEQSLVLLLRAIVNEPELLILDEALSGMDLRMVEVTKRYLRERFGDNQTIVWISHWDSEVPWGTEDELRKFSLDNGEGQRS